MNDIYMDNAAGTRLLEEVFDEMLPFFTDEFGNPSSIHHAGSAPKEAVELAIELSETTYCSASAILKKAVDIETSYEIRES